MTESPVRLVYILGFGRSGSTLLDMLLGSLDGICSVGEVWALGRWVIQDRACSCNYPVSRCPIWAPITELLPSVVGSLDLFFRQNEPYRNRLVEVLGLANEQLLFRKYLDGQKNFARSWYLIFTYLAKITGAEIFVDSSKMLDRLARLGTSDYFDVKVIHLVRHGLALVDGARRAHQRGVYKKRVIPPRLILGWAIEAIHQVRFLKTMLKPDQVLTVDYRNLATYPHNTLANICEFLGRQFNPRIVDPPSPKYVFRQAHHLIGGNRLKASAPDTQIRYDASWENRLLRTDRMWFILLGGHRINRLLGAS